MNNAKRDYSRITDEERQVWESLQEKEIVYRDGKPTKFRRSLYLEYPKAVRHYISLFPNYFLDRVDLKYKKQSYEEVIRNFR